MTVASKIPASVGQANHPGKSGHFRELFALLDFRPKIQILKMAKYQIPMHRNRSISFCYSEGVEEGANY